MFRIERRQPQKQEKEELKVETKLKVNLNVNFKTFVINLNHRKDRLDSISKELEQIGITNWERFPGIIPSSIPNTFLRTKEEGYKKGSYGCLLSHLGVIKKAKEENLEYVLILEDDTGFKNNIVYLEDILKNKNWDMLYLNVTNAKHSRIFLNLLKLDFGFTTNAYFVHSRLYDFLIERLPKISEEIDLFYARDVHPKYNCYCVTPFMTYQKQSYSNILNKNVNYNI